MRKTIIAIASFFIAALSNITIAQTSTSVLDSLIKQCGDSLLAPSFFQMKEQALKMAAELEDYEGLTKISQYMVFRYYLDVIPTPS